MMSSGIKEQFSNLWNSILSSNSGTYNTSEYQTKDGGKLYFEWHNIPLIEPNGTTIGVASLVQNITQREEAEKALRQVNEELEQRVESRTKQLAKANQILQAEISERKQAEQALSESKMRLHSVVTQAPIILYAIDNDGNITFLEGKELENWESNQRKLLAQTLTHIIINSRFQEISLKSSKIMLNLESLNLETQFTKTVSH